MTLIEFVSKHKFVHLLRTLWLFPSYTKYWFLSGCLLYLAQLSRVIVLFDFKEVLSVVIHKLGNEMLWIAPLAWDNGAKGKLNCNYRATVLMNQMIYNSTIDVDVSAWPHLEFEYVLHLSFLKMHILLLFFLFKSDSLL